jgi:hypothetical protein
MRFGALLLLASCKQVLGLEAPTRAVDAAPVSDVAGDGGIDAVQPAVCTPGDSTLAACFDFENTLANGSRYDITARATEVTYVPGKLGLAVSVDSASLMTIDETPALDVAQLTIEAWVKPHMIPPAGARAGIFDNNGQYGLFLVAGGIVRCFGNGMVDGPAVAIDEWAHLACTFDGSTLTLFVNGTNAAQGAGAALTTSGVDGSAIGMNSPSGDPLTGDIDSLRIYSVARSPTQICVDAGRTDCP